MSESALNYRLYLVPSASHAVKGENALIVAGIACALIPVPRTISSECGVCLRVSLKHVDHASEVLSGADVQISGTHDP